MDKLFSSGDYSYSSLNQGLALLLNQGVNRNRKLHQCFNCCRRLPNNLQRFVQLDNMGHFKICKKCIEQPLSGGNKKWLLENVFKLKRKPFKPLLRQQKPIVEVLHKLKQRSSVVKSKTK